MRWALVVVACAACDTVLGLHKTVSADAPGDTVSYAGHTCAQLVPFDSLRYFGADIGSGAGFTTSIALALCQARGMELVSFDDGDTMELARELSGASFYYWTGLTYTSAGWANPDGCLPPNLWRAGQPATNDTSQCGLMTDDNLIAASCGNSTYGTAGSINALCETPRPSPQCYQQWNSSGDTTRYAIPSQTVQVSKQTAETMCKSPAHLVEIDSGDELATVNTFASSHGIATYWVGAQYSAAGWASPTGCPIVFAWTTAKPEPDTSGGQSCVFEAVDGMRTAACASTASNSIAFVICETDP